MKSSTTSSYFGLYNPVKVFSKIYNAFYCSRKRESGQSPEAPVTAEVGGGQLEKQWFTAVKEENIEKIKEMLEKGVDPNVKDEHGWSALQFAAWNGFVPVCTVLLTTPGLCVDLSGPGDSTALSLACQRGHTRVVQVLLGNDRTSPGCDVNHHATIGEHRNVTPLHLAAQHGHADICRLLLAFGADVNASMETRSGTVTGVTPLHLAVQTERLDVMEVLLQTGADVQSSTQLTKAAATTQAAAAATVTAALVVNKEKEDNETTC